MTTNYSIQIIFVKLSLLYVLWFFNNTILPLSLCLLIFTSMTKTRAFPFSDDFERGFYRCQGVVAVQKKTPPTSNISFQNNPQEVL